MKLERDSFRLAATDLANHLACRHLTALDRGLAEGRWKPPDWYRPEAEVLAQRGLEHERAYLAYLEQQGKTITRLEPEADGASALQRTLAAMVAGAEVIAQATLTVDRWFGRADVLLKVERPSGLGAWSYEALDTKLAQETKAGAVLQLCLYSDLLRVMQDRSPEHMYVVPRRPGFPLETYRVDDYLAYYRLVRRRLEAAVAARADDEATYPEPVPHCDVCRWWPRCDRQRRADDHLCLVAGVSRSQRQELRAHDIATLARLAVEPVPIAWKPARGAKEGYLRVREQARIQLQGRTEQQTLHELLPIVSGHGLTLLPEPSPGDLFLDLEADPYVDEGGLEYLFGWAITDAPPAGMLALEVGTPVYHRHWALDRTAERAGFETLIDTIMRRWDTDRNMHVYHYGAYEPGAVKRLMGRYATREAEVDRLLRGGRFVDLHAIVKHALRASVEEYSIKKLEPCYGFERAQPLDQAGAAMRVIQRGLELGETVAPGDAHAAIVEAYNRDDCLSALALRDWLETLRAGAEAEGTEVPRPPVEPDEPNEKVREREQRANELAARLLAGIPEEARTEAEQAQWLLAHVLDWHRREEKSAWWEYYRLRERSDEELLDEMPALSGLEFVARLPGKGRTPVERYRFPAQETKIREGDKLHLPLPDGRELGDVVDIDLAALTVDIKKRGACADLAPASAFAHDSYPSTEQFESLMRLGGWVAANGLDAPGPWRAARDLLLRRGPRLGGGTGGALEAPGEGGVAAARRIALLLDRAALAIQGPPGAGKTFTGAHMICDLVRAGKRVGVCAQSHKVIANLMQDVVRYAAREGVRVACLRKVTEKSAVPDPGIAETTDNAEIPAALRGGQAHVVGGTAYLWSREAMFEAVDVLFVDEAGQMSLANVLAIAQGAKSLVLLGDPQQLEQPIQGTHPEGTEVSALEHVLGGSQTIAAERGLFLDETWRLAPAICAFTSELFYERRLRSRPGLERQALLGDTPFAGAGLWFVPVEHDANQSASREEVGVITQLVGALAEGGLRWRDGEGQEHPLGVGDILVIAPYNAQVSDLHQRLPAEVRVGTVDKFQGQQAPVVIYSLATSTPQDAPRGMDFLYDPNRFNVATSRAKCVCIVVGSPRLFEPDCQSPKQMRLANAFCRFLELAREVRLDAPSALGVASG
ncbi:MAG: TM0106 family RecB-like putative nuclease [Candidatus Eisenbacteria bacterium]|uniref:TM0106 family RecB-like putative nuclease n=1 Tax=Eiseniibacteriota bacterium TaxID=2212470 RepID=A0A538UCS8_UNCEI|nr:MAG: TM0106 family RecB-like putative nuclease [Candidatus Eisenbacteria bacterium]